MHFLLLTASMATRAPPWCLARYQSLTGCHEPTSAPVQRRNRQLSHAGGRPFLALVVATGMAAARVHALKATASLAFDAEDASVQRALLAPC